MTHRITKIALLAAAFTALFIAAAVAQTNKANKGVRTLDDINIEGEIAVPQVLFITSRDYPRYRDSMRLKFRMSALEVARSVDLPTRLRVVAKQTQYKEEGI